ncbi:efflux RND transporter periplasmic adaptor subunit [Empedobacter sp. 225-1]|uniref:efflux RND transporter periplasmic adaptor subunit n=1 Tax=Empedobacter sp. 225-1 TaxID=2746725 RepID=UPI0025758203|nr:efflux RND transporter periplasmic adaptor subunit [Empedobacter sp. 225-1]MDM1523264.1 efflux RND transporter periplasmic adaptor subunit [Empedobacter sp. 225-1]
MKNVNVMMVGALAIALSSCGKKDNAQAQAQGPTPYPVVDVPTRVVTSYDEYPTNIEGVVNNEVRAKIQGYITEVYVDEGQYVQAGQPLFRLETNVLTQNADAARSGVGAAQASVKSAQANVNAAKASVNAAQVEVDKLTPLVQKNIISNVQLETAKANLAKAQASYNQALAAVGQAQASVTQAQANYKGAQANVDYSVVRAPISGVLGSINFRQGTLVGPSDPTAITTVSNTSKVYAYFSMNEKEYLNFISKSEGATLKEKLDKIPAVDLVLANGEIYPEKGKIQTVTGQINPTTGTIDFRVSFNNEARILANGNSGRIRVPKTFVDVLVVPEAATFEQQGLTYVYKVTKDTAYATPITVVERANNMAVVKEGVKKGDKVVAQGVGKLRDKTAVKPMPANFDTIVNSTKTVF